MQNNVHMQGCHGGEDDSGLRVRKFWMVSRVVEPKEKCPSTDWK